MARAEAWTRKHTEFTRHVEKVQYWKDEQARTTATQKKKDDDESRKKEVADKRSALSLQFQVLSAKRNKTGEGAAKKANVLKIEVRSKNKEKVSKLQTRKSVAEKSQKEAAEAGNKVSHGTESAQEKPPRL